MVLVPRGGCHGHPAIVEAHGEDACANTFVPYSEGVPPLRSLSLVLAGIVASTIASAAGVSSLATSSVTVYSAKWCGACRSLQSGLADRKIPFDVVDIDDNPSAFSRARATSGAGSAIPLTSVARTSNTVWIVGADVDAVDRAQRGE